MFWNVYDSDCGAIFCSIILIFFSLFNLLFNLSLWSDAFRSYELLPPSSKNIDLAHLFICKWHQVLCWDLFFPEIHNLNIRKWMFNVSMKNMYATLSYKIRWSPLIWNEWFLQLSLCPHCLCAYILLKMCSSLI